MPLPQTYVSRRGRSRSISVYISVIRYITSFRIPVWYFDTISSVLLLLSVILRMCDNCTTIVKVRLIIFVIVCVRVREIFFVRGHFYQKPYLVRSCPIRLPRLQGTRKFQSKQACTITERSVKVRYVRRFGIHTSCCDCVKQYLAK